MGDHVVHLPGDPRALGGGGDPGLLVTLALQLPGPLGEGAEGIPPVPHADAQQEAGHDRPGEQDEGPDPGQASQGPADGGQQRAGLHRAGGQDPGPQPVPAGDGVEVHQQGDVGRHLHVEHPLDQRHRDDAPELGQRKAPAPDQRDHQQDAEGQGRPELAGLIPGQVHELAQRARGQRRGQHGVGRRGVRADRGGHGPVPGLDPAGHRGGAGTAGRLRPPRRPAPGRGG
jgi:hypothetical protein